MRRESFVRCQGRTMAKLVQMRRNLPVTDRQRLRTYFLAQEMEKAAQRAAEWYTHPLCVKAMKLHGAAAAELHGKCPGELPPNGPGCLCPCHDDNRGGVEAGTAPEMGDTEPVLDSQPGAGEPTRTLAG